MIIDEEKQNALTNFQSKVPRRTVKTSDHNSMFVQFQLKTEPEKLERKVMFNYKDEEALSHFKNVTTNTNELSDCFRNEESLDKQAKKWIKTLKSFLNRVFKKVRISNRKKNKRDDEMEVLLNRRKEAIEIGDEQNQDILECQIKELEAKRNVDTIRKHIEEMKNNPRDRDNNVWKMKRKLFPKSEKSLPTAKYNNDGQLITNHSELKEVYLEHFQHRLRQRPMILELTEYQKKVEDEFKELLASTEHEITAEWKMEDLEKVLQTLKSKQSQDSNGFANEIFQLKNIGDDLKKSLLILCNKIKKENHLPAILRDAVISAIPKNKKNQLKLENQRGIFLTNKVKSVLMKLIYNSIIEDVEDNLSESNIGARKDRATRDHVFVINSIINEVKKDKTKEPIDLVFYDIKECYNSSWLEKI